MDEETIADGMRRGQMLVGGIVPVVGEIQIKKNHRSFGAKISGINHLAKALYAKILIAKMLLVKSLESMLWRGMIRDKCFGINDAPRADQSARSGQNLGGKRVACKILCLNELACCYSIVKELML